MINSTIGQYTILEELGRGGMAVAYRAHDRSLNREVAIKVLPREFLHDPTFQARFIREAQTIAGLEHPAIVPIYDFGDHDGQPFFVMRYMSGGSLAGRITGGPLPLGDASKIIDRIGAALDAAHARAIIHRDVKPGNILFDSYGDAYLSDFGIVRLAEATAQLTGSGIVGTPAYMAPEISLPGGLSKLVDVYALGATLFQMLTGYQPYQADTPMGTALAHTTNPIPDIRNIRPELPEGIQSVINQGLAKDPAERYQSAGELAEGLREVLSTASVEVRATGTEESPPLIRQAGSDIVAPTLPEGLVEPTLPEIEQQSAAPVQAATDQKSKPWLWLVLGGVIGFVALISVVIAALAGVFTRPEETVLQEMETATEEPTDIPESTETPTPTETPKPTETPLPPGFKPVTNNTNWEPVIEEIDGIPMVLVPAGCFEMGSTESDTAYTLQLCEKAWGAGPCREDLYADETPQHRVCFEEPFWIDVYEVTNEQYGSSGYWSGDDRPREMINWYDAAEHCESRGARLPTEAEWEYAARGPDGLVFPWGNVVNGILLNNCDVNCIYDWADRSVNDGYGYTAPVGSYPGGISWVGALDLSGNVWEWVNDWYDEGYYEGLTDGMVNPQGPESGEERGMRGGSWDNDYVGPRTAYRFSYDPGHRGNFAGFRCARSYSQQD